jgi:hypothetical protein
MGQCVRWWSPKRRARRPSATCKAVQSAFVISFITALTIHSSGVCGENSACSSLVLHNHPQPAKRGHGPVTFMTRPRARSAAGTNDCTILHSPLMHPPSKTANEHLQGSALQPFPLSEPRI